MSAWWSAMNGSLALATHYGLAALTGLELRDQADESVAPAAAPAQGG